MQNALGFLFPENPSRRLEGLEETKINNTPQGVFGLYLQKGILFGKTELIQYAHNK
jgi:hypothetical protein